jgi:predicted acylesterase/phospholipase RssA
MVTFRSARHHQRWLLVLWVVSAIVVSGCATSVSRNPTPETLVDPLGLPDLTEIRHWGDLDSPHTRKWLATPADVIAERFSGIVGTEHHYLCISGGGAEGAFGAGLLVGWTEAGTRPEFTFVTGISTGAITAPFAFLGPAYDAKLEEIYTTYSTGDLLQKRGIFKILKGDAIIGTDPLQHLLATYVDERMLEDLAAEYRKGRQLNIGTTNLDAGRPVVWNVTRIAASGHPRALELIRQIILASAAIPTLFPPVYIQVASEGQVYDEMHVDGGTTSQVFFYPADVDMGAVVEKFDVRGTPRLYLIFNSWIEPEFEPVDPELVPITRRSVSTLIRTQGVGDLYRLYLLAGRDNIDYNLAFIPDTFHEKPAEEFDVEYMGKLFDLGYELARKGFAWEKVPPGFEPEE